MDQLRYPKLLTIQDISCVGQCSLTVALPILSACGAETCILPSAVLSTHTGGFKGFTVRDLTADMPAVAAHWKKEGISFDAVYTGYLGSIEQIGYVQDIIRDIRKQKAMLVDEVIVNKDVDQPAIPATVICFSLIGLVILGAVRGS